MSLKIMSGAETLRRALEELRAAQLIPRNASIAAPRVAWQARGDAYDAASTAMTLVLRDEWDNLRALAIRVKLIAAKQAAADLVTEIQAGALGVFPQDEAG